jgi:hypothetical protein
MVAKRANDTKGDWQKQLPSKHVASSEFRAPSSRISVNSSLTFEYIPKQPPVKEEDRAGL